MCLMCAEFNKGRMKPKEMARALREHSETDPHIDEIIDLVVFSGDSEREEFLEALVEEMGDDV